MWIGRACRAFSAHLDAHFLFSLLGSEGKCLLCWERYFSLATISILILQQLPRVWTAVCRYLKKLDVAVVHPLLFLNLFGFLKTGLCPFSGLGYPT
jgi:hypothetical protein